MKRYAIVKEEKVDYNVWEAYNYNWRFRIFGPDIMFAVSQTRSTYSADDCEKLLRKILSIKEPYTVVRIVRI